MDEYPFLQRLLAEAPVEAFEEPLRDARERGLDGDRLEALREATVLAMQLRSVLQERRHRELELAALYETAGDLISIRHVERVLKAIARRARQLLDADTAYLTLIDEESGDTYMRVTDGMVTPEFGRLRLPLGVGLGGLVAQTAMPYFTSDYLHDRRFRHTAAIDDAVGGEQLNAILGVPLKLGDRVLGVLFAANRQARPFSPNEVNLLASLAAHAAIAIENARLFQEARDAVSRLNATNDVVQAHSEAVERAAAAHERLTALVVHGGTLSDLASAVGEILGGRLRVLDADGRLLARGRPSAGDDQTAVPDDTALREAAERARAVGRTARVDAGGRTVWVTPVIAGAEQLATLVLVGDLDGEGIDRRTLERAAQVTALLLLNERSLAEAERRVRGELLDDLLTRPQRDADGVRRRARLLAADLDAPHAVVVASVSGAQRRRLSGVLAGTVGRGALVGERRGALVAFLPRAEPAEAAAHAGKVLTEAAGSPATVGAAGAAAGPAALLDAYEEADRCRRTLLALGREGAAATAEDLGVFALLFGEAGRGELDRFVDRTLGPVLAYDGERGTDLAATLEAYFAAGGNLTRAAGALHVHVNTLYQRLDRVGVLLTPSWQEADGALQVQLALTIRRLRDAVL